MASIRLSGLPHFRLDFSISAARRGSTFALAKKPSHCGCDYHVGVVRGLNTFVEETFPPAAIVSGSCPSVAVAKKTGRRLQTTVEDDRATDLHSIAERDMTKHHETRGGGGGGGGGGGWGGGGGGAPPPYSEVSKPLGLCESLRRRREIVRREVAMQCMLMNRVRIFGNRVHGKSLASSGRRF